MKIMTNLHERIAEQLNRILIGENDLPGWMTYGHTILCQKDVSKGNAAENYGSKGMFQKEILLRTCIFI